MFNWIREVAEKKRLQEEHDARIDDSIRNGAKTIGDVMTGRLSLPKIKPEERLVLEKLPYVEFRSRMGAIIKNFKPFPHRYYSQSEVSVILDDYTHTYWLSTIRDNVAKKFKEEDFSLQHPKEEFIKRCLSEAYERGFTPGIYDLSREEHISYLSRYWSVKFLDIDEDRTGELLFGKEMHQLAKAIVKAQNDF